MFKIDIENLINEFCLLIKAFLNYCNFQRKNIKNKIYTEWFNWNSNSIPNKGKIFQIEENIAYLMLCIVL